MKRQLEICRKCHMFMDMKDMFDVYLCGEIMEVVCPSNRCEEWLRKKVPKCCPYFVEHHLKGWNDEEKH